MRARELGIEIGTGTPGALNAITDVEGVLVGHTTLIEGSDVRTGVTVVVPAEEPVFAAPFRLNGNGEMTGLEWVRESGLLTTPVAITNTHSGTTGSPRPEALKVLGRSSCSWRQTRPSSRTSARDWRCGRRSASPAPVAREKIRAAI